MLKSRFAIPALILSVALAPARAEQCPAKSLKLDDILIALNAASSCEESMKIFETCAFGSSGDVQLGEAVEKTCERDFFTRLTTSQKQAYQSKMRRCDRKYENESGTMYVSFAAFCRAELARRYSRHALKRAGSSRAR